ncbi:hypothetical protein GF312_21970, partial [Candidatus Poribacteria bacterium]|nr:hypothetical protein [Candidatus Poribacteria bacterium]
IGLLGGLKAWIFYILLLILLAVSVFDIKYIIINSVKLLLSFVKKLNWKSVEAVLLAVIILHFLFAFICCLAPQTDWDSQVHHILVPKVFLNEGKIWNVKISDDWFFVGFNYPSNMEMLFTLGMLLSSDILATLIAWSVSVFLAIGVYSLSRQYYSFRLSLFAAVIAYCCPLVILHSTANTVDIGVAFFALLALYAALKWLDSEDSRFIILSGIYAGLCAGTKYTGLIVFFVLALFIALWSLIEHKKRLKFVNPFLLFCLVSVMVLSPWYIKNYVYTGNPVYPFFAKIIGGRGLPPTALKHGASTAWKGFDDYENWYSLILSYLRFPWDLTMLNSSFHKPGNSIGVLYLLFIPCLVFMRKVDRKIKHILLYSLMGLTIVFGLAQRPRYMFQFIPPLAVVASYSIYRLSEKDIVIKRVCALIITFAVLFNLLLIMGLAYIRLPVVFGINSKDEYLSKRMEGYYNAILYINKNLSDDNRIISNDLRFYYCEVPCIRDSNVIDYNILQGDEDRLLERLRELKVTHVLVNVNFGTFRQQSVRNIYDKIIHKGRLREIFSRNEISFYEIK